MQIEYELLSQCRKNDRKAHFQLYKLCYGILMKVCLRYKKDKGEAEEMLNTGFMKVVNSIEKYNDNIPFDAWIKKIMINTVIDDFRRQAKHKETITYSNNEELIESNQKVEIFETHKQIEIEELEKMLWELPNMTQKVFNLFAIDGYSHTEIATLLGIAEGTSKWHVASARKQLQEKIVKMRLVAFPQLDDKR